MTIHIAIGTDHRGFAYKEQLKKHASWPVPIIWQDVGCFSSQRCDYPPFARAVVQMVRKKEASRGILLCGSGIGVCIAANRFVGIYAALVWNQEVARASSADDHANILCIPADYLSFEEIVPIIHAWLTTPAKPGIYGQRLDMIDGWGGL